MHFIGEIGKYQRKVEKLKNKYKLVKIECANLSPDKKYQIDSASEESDPYIP